MLGMAGYYASLDYAKNRPQGRPVGPGGQGPGPAAGAHHRARRRQAHAAGAEVLLRRRAGAGAVLRAAGRRAAHRATPQAADEARLLLEVLTPIAKSWPSEWCLEANSLAIQVHGGYGYTRDFPVEQYWRDNRLNMIHEGTHGIQAADLLGRKVLMEGGRGLQLLAGRIDAHDRARQPAARAGRARQRAGPGAAAGRRGHQGGLGHRRSRRGAGQCRALHAGLRPHGAGLDLAGRGAGDPAGQRADAPAHAGPAAARRAISIHYELPKIGAWLRVVANRDPTCAEMPEEAF